MHQIVNHKLVGVPYKASPNISGMLDPSYVVMHYTAGWNAASAVATLVNPASKVSAHLVVDRDGSVTQLVPFNRVAWHAGPSAYQGHKFMNNFAIGIEIVNIGFLKPLGDGRYALSNGRDWTPVPPERLKDYDLTLSAANARVGGGTLVWPAYTKVQIEALKEIFAAIVATYHIKDVCSHEEIDTRKWKTDPGPAFPMGEFKAMIPNGGSRAADNVLHGTFKARQAVNVRREPSINAGVVTVLHPGQEVAVCEDLGEWSHVEYAPGKFGFVTDKFLVAA